MEEVPELPLEPVKEASKSGPERLMEIVIRVCDRYGFPHKKERPQPDEQVPKR